MGKHLVFYDGECGLCDHVVEFIIKFDKGKNFDFAPLNGKTAQNWPELPLYNDSVILVENYKNEPLVALYSSAVFRIFYLLKGIWVLPGLFYFLPSFLFDWAYCLIARNRKTLFPVNQCFLPLKNNKTRFLP